VTDRQWKGHVDGASYSSAEVAVNRHDLETALFALLGIAQVAFLLMLRGLWGNGVDLRFWVPVVMLPLYVVSAAALHVELGRRVESGIGFNGQKLIVALGAFTIVTGLVLAPRMSAQMVTLIQLGVMGVGLGLASAVGYLLRRLRLADDAASGGRSGSGAEPPADPLSGIGPR